MSTRVGADVLIKKLITIIPDDQVKLRDNLVKLSESWWNQAPELLCNDQYWLPVGNVLSEHIHDFDSDWKVKVRDIYNTGGMS